MQHGENKTHLSDAVTTGLMQNFSRLLSLSFALLCSFHSPEPLLRICISSLASYRNTEICQRETCLLSYVPASLIQPVAMTIADLRVTDLEDETAYIRD